jgi:hypothetical protein
VHAAKRNETVASRSTRTSAIGEGTTTKSSADQSISGRAAGNEESESKPSYFVLILVKLFLDILSF